MQKKHILYLEDDTDLAELILSGLRFSGYSVDWAESAAAARGLLAPGGRHYDLMLFDHHVNGASGTEIAGEARAAGFMGPILLLSGDSNPMLHAVDNSAITARLHKPLTLSELLGALAAHLPRS